MASYNRSALTLAALRSLQACELPTDTRLTIYLLDDASPDGTADQVRSAFPQVRLLEGDGHRYWAGGMRVAFGAALAEGFDYYLWFNDDVTLAPDAIRRLAACHRNLAADGSDLHLISGAMRDASGRTTYGGLQRASKALPWRHRLLPPDPLEPRPCETVHGNLVLIPAALAARLGNIDPHFQHSIGDLDYGLRARRAGAKVWLAPGYYGWCARETSSRAKWDQPGLSLQQRWARIQHPLGLPFRDHWTYYTRHFGAWAPLVGLSPYVRLLVGHFLSGGPKADPGR